MTVMSATSFLKSVAIMTKAGDSNGERTAAYNTDPYATMSIMTHFFVVLQLRGSFGSSDLQCGQTRAVHKNIFVAMKIQMSTYG